MLSIARILVTLGLILLVIGGLIYMLDRLGLNLGKLPGDIRFEGDNFTCVFPLATMILLSVVLTVLLNVIIRLINK